MLRLINGVLHGFEANKRAIVSDVPRAIAGSENARIGGSRTIVHNNPVIAGETGALCNLHIGYNPNSHERQIRRKRLTARAHGFQPAVSLKALDRRIQLDLHARIVMYALIKRGNVRRNRSRHHAIERLENGNLKTEFGGHSSNFQSYIAAADHGESLARAEVCAQGVDVGNSPQVEDSRQTCAFDANAPYPRPSRQQEFFIGNHVAIR